MKKSTLAIGVAALAVLTAGSAMAQQAPRGARADADGDGRISRAEFVDGRIARLTALDTNRDGSISVEERRAARQAHRAERVATRFAALDKNGDGSVSREEFTAPRERGDRAERAGRQGMRQGGHHGGPRGGWGRGGGHGHGGERGQNAEARGPLVIADVQTRLTNQFDRVDTNRDGFISAEERTAARQAMREQWGERRAERMARRQASPSAPASE